MYLNTEICKARKIINYKDAKAGSWKGPNSAFCHVTPEKF